MVSCVLCVNITALLLTYLTTSECPWDAANSRGVAPAAFLWLMLRSFVVSPSPTMGVEEEDWES